jgi:hypothetical protein
MSEPFFRLSNPSPKAGHRRGGYNHAKGGDHSCYITRESATGGDRAAIVSHQLPAHAAAGDNYREQRTNITSYFSQRVEDELETGKGARTHYRMTASFGEHVDTKTARQMAQEFLATNFPDGRGIACVHRNTPATHIHFYLEARAVDKSGRDSKKLDLDPQRFKSLNKNWTELHERYISRDDAQQHRAKVAETERWKREYRQAKTEGRETSSPAPERQRKRNGRETYNRTEAREYANQAGAFRDERPVISRPSALPERGADSILEEGERAVAAAHRAAKQLFAEANRLGRTHERTIEQADLGKGLNR